MQSRITELDPSRKLAFSWEGNGDVSFELEPKGNDVLLTVIQRRLADRATLLMVGAGWHMHLDIPFVDSVCLLGQGHRLHRLLDQLKGKVESNEPTSLPESWTSPISGLAGWFD